MMIRYAADAAARYAYLLRRCVAADDIFDDAIISLRH